MTAPVAITDPTGRCFVSYRRSRLDDVRRLVAALHDHGVPTWQDLTDLDEEPLEPALRAALTDPSTASGILWITPEVANSAVITGVEIPELIARAERGDAFFLLPVAAGGLNYANAARAALARTTLNDFEAWNIARVGHDPISDADADGVARRVLARRIAAIDAALPAGAPFVIDVYTRGPVAHRPDAALTVDLTHRFNGRQAHAGAWQNHILPALDTIVDETARRASGRPLQLRGLAGLPAAVALGAKLLAPRAVSAAWMQHTPGRDETAYSLAEERRPSGFRVAIRDHRPDAADLAVLVSVSENTVPAVRATGGLPEFRGWLQAAPPGRHPHPHSHPHLFPGPGEAVDLAHEVIETIRAARSRYGRVGDVHLFIAGPAGLAFLLGQLLNTLGTVHTYEHVNDHGVGHYQPAVALEPSG
ncbi:MAG TPA: SAVED domain-containing protein [Kribbellaceae bacterium]|nr:SAVED domain-containing protein [Kribbellaceae bacterium]